MLLLLVLLRAAWLLVALLLSVLRRHRLEHMPTRAQDKIALLEFFRLLGGTSWRRADGWDPAGVSDPCQTRWYGVGCVDPCDAVLDGPACFFGRIVSISLADNNLAGSMAEWSELGELHNLSTLDLANNHIRGYIPVRACVLEFAAHLARVCAWKLTEAVRCAMGGVVPLVADRDWART